MKNTPIVLAGRRKISIASQINNMHSDLLKGVFPSSLQVKFNINNNRSDKASCSQTTTKKE